MKKLFFCLTFLCVTISFSQSKDFKIFGSILSEDENIPLESATVYLERVKDSTLITYTISDKDGKLNSFIAWAFGSMTAGLSFLLLLFALANFVDEEVTVELNNGKTYTLRAAWAGEVSPLNVKDGQLEVTFYGIEMIEQ